MPKCPPFRHYEQRKHVKSFFYEKLWEFSVQATAWGRDDLFFGRQLIFGGKLDICGRNDFQRSLSSFYVVKIW